MRKETVLNYAKAQSHHLLEILRETTKEIKVVVGPVDIGSRILTDTYQNGYSLI